MRGLWLVGLMMCVACGGSASDGGSSGGSAGSGNGGNAGSGATGGSGVTGGSGGSSGSAGSGGSGGDDFSTCKVPSDCVVIPASCCGSCGAATRTDSVAVNKASAPVYQNWTCGDMGCADCYMPTDANLVATCSAGRCAVVDLLATPATECTDSNECHLRTNECCECGGAQDAEHLVAVSDYSAIERVVCGSGQGCPECAPQPPDYAEAICDDGRCTVQWLLGNN